MRYSLGAKIAATPEGMANCWRWYSAPHESSAIGQTGTRQAGAERVRGGDGDLAKRAVDRGGVPAVNAVQRASDVAADSGQTDQVGHITFPGATGPVGQDGAPIVFFYGSRSGTDAFDTSHPGRQDIGGYGCRTYRTQVPIRDLRERVPRYDGF